MPHSNPPISPGFSTPPSSGGGAAGYQEVPICEPDLNKRPIRSALKGAKNKEMLQRQLEEKLRERHIASEGGGAGHGVSFFTPNARPDLQGPRVRISGGGRCVNYVISHFN